MNLERLAELETIDPRPLPPWRAEPFTEIEIQPDLTRNRRHLCVSRHLYKVRRYLLKNGSTSMVIVRQVAITSELHTQSIVQLHF